MIDKPAGLVVHPGAGNETGTLVNALIAHCGDSLSGIGGVRRPGIVHRLDKDTSGLLVVAKNDAAHQGLSEQFAAHGRDGRLERSYLAIVWGVPERQQRHDLGQRSTAAPPTARRWPCPAAPAAREAVTHYEVLETLGKPPLASLRPLPTRDRPHPPDPRASWPISAIRCWAIRSMVQASGVPPASCLTRQGSPQGIESTGTSCHDSGLRAPRVRASPCTSKAPRQHDFATLLDALRLNVHGTVTICNWSGVLFSA